MGTNSTWSSKLNLCPSESSFQEKSSGWGSGLSCSRCCLFFVKFIVPRWHSWSSKLNLCPSESSFQEKSLIRQDKSKGSFFYFLKVVHKFVVCLEGHRTKSLFAYIGISSWSTWHTLKTLFTLFSIFSISSISSVISCRSYIAPFSLLSIGTVFAICSCRSLGSFRSLQTLLTLSSVLSPSSGCSHFTLLAIFTGHTWFSLLSVITFVMQQ